MSKRERDAEVEQLQDKVVVCDTADHHIFVDKDVVDLICRLAVRKATEVVFALQKCRAQLAAAEDELRSVKAVNHEYFAEVSELQLQLEAHKIALQLMKQ